MIIIRNYKKISFVLLLSLILIPNISSAAFVGATSNFSNTLTSGLVGWWTMDGKDVLNGRVIDKSGSGNTGYNLNISTTTFYTFGKIGQAFNFDGINDNISFPSTVSGVKSVSFWMKATSTTQSIMDFNGTQNIDMSAGTLRANNWTAATIYIDGVQTSAVADTNWHHVAITTATSFDASSFFIGKISTAFYGGILDAVRIYNRTLSASEVLQIYQGGIGTKQNISGSTVNNSLRTGMTGWWTFDGADTNFSTGRVTDKSGNGGTGSLVGGFSTTTSIAAGKIGQALYFGGSPQLVTSSSLLSTIITSATGTVSVWFYPIGSQTTGCSTGDMSGLVVDGTAGGGFFWLGYDGSNVCAGGFDGSTRSVSGAATTGKWNHAVWQHKNGVLSLWVNGTFAGAAAFGNITDLTHAIHIGRSFSSAYFRGYIDDVRAYNTALSTTSIQQLYYTGASTINVSQNINKSTGLDNGLVGWWTFDGKDVPSGRFLDKSGTADTGYLTGIASTTFYDIGKIGQAVNFDGTDDLLRVPDPGAFEFNSGDSITASFWIKPQRIRNPDTVFGKDEATYVFQFHDTSGALDFIFYNGTSFFTFTPDSVVSLNKWSHIAFTYTYGSSGSAKYYINGQAVTGSWDTPSNSAPANGNGDLYIGRSSFPGENYKGFLDDLRLYKRTLTASEVQQLYMMGK
jgi:hypothetical protein